MIKGNKANRPRQVQFRMDPELFNKLKETIVYDKDFIAWPICSMQPRLNI